MTGLSRRTRESFSGPGANFAILRRLSGDESRQQAGATAVKQRADAHNDAAGAAAGGSAAAGAAAARASLDRSIQFRAQLAVLATKTPDLTDQTAKGA